MDPALSKVVRVPMVPSNGAWQAYRTALWKIPMIVRFLTAMPGYVNLQNIRDINGNVVGKYEVTE